MIHILHRTCCFTGFSFFDVWSIVHLCFWVFVGSTLWAYKLNKWVAFLNCMGVAYAWEVFEHFMAPTHPNVWQDPESFCNSWISDPLMCAIGFFGIWWLLDHRKRK